MTIRTLAKHTLVDIMRANARTHASAPALTFAKNGNVTEAVSLTWRQLDLRARAVAGVLIQHGPAGSRAIVACPPGLEYAVAFFGCLYAGWIPVPAPAPASPRRDYRLSAIANNAGAILALTTSEGLATAMQAAPGLPWQALAAAAEDPTPDGVASFSAPIVGDLDVAFLQYTSGSTSEPKGVVVTHRALLAQLVSLVEGSDIESGESLVCWMPLYHDYGLVGHLLLAAYAGAHAVLLPPAAFLRRPACWLQAVTHYRATITGGPNFALDLCCKRISDADRSTLDLSSLRTIGCGGEPVSAATVAQFANRFSNCGLAASAIAPAFGMAEAVLMLTSLPPRMRGCALPRATEFSADGVAAGRARAPRVGEATRTLVACGRPARGVEIRIVHRESRQRCPDQVIGEIWVKGATVAAGYWGTDHAEESTATFAARMADGSGPWLRTGDLGVLHEGQLIITGRRKEMIIVRGHNHYPTDIERTAQDADLALDGATAAAFGVTINGEERVVLVQEIARSARRTVDANAVMARVRDAVSEAHGISLHDVVLVEPLTVPKTSSGKVQRLMCREQWLANQLEVIERLRPSVPDEATLKAAKLRDEVFAFVSTAAQRTTVAANDTLRGSLGFDSLGLVELIVAAEERFDVRISEERAGTMATVADFAEAIMAAPAEGTIVGIGDLRAQIMEQIPQLRVEVEAQNGRELLVEGRWIADFASANYLGLDLHPDVIAAVQPAIERWGVHPSWTRIVASPKIYSELEQKLAEFVGAPEVLVFPTVTLAHAGLLPLLAGSSGAIFVDSEAHASVHDGAALAGARGAEIVTYPHGDHAKLAELLAASTHSAKIIATDGVFSMSADYEDLHALAALAKRFDARVYVDDAHGIGVVGAHPSPADPYGAGNGLVQRCGLDYVADRIIYVSGLSKAFSSLAAFVTCVDAREKALFATAGTAVFSGPCPTASLATAIAGLDVVAREGPAIRRRLRSLTDQLVEGARAFGFTVDNHEGFPLVSVVIGKTADTIAACQVLWEHGILITPGIFPAAPHDRGLLRFTVTAANTEAQIIRALSALADITYSTRAIEIAEDAA